MKNNFSITLENLSFFAYHGLYESEKTNGNDFLVNITIKYSSSSYNIISITDVLDYTKVYETVKTCMKKPTELLENVCSDISKQLMEKFVNIKKIDISVSKLNPPIGGKCEKSTVTFSEKR